MTITMTATCNFGLEAVLHRELKNLELTVLSVQDGRIDFCGEPRDLARANLWLRAAERIYLKMGEFKAVTFDELFEGTRALDWPSVLPVNAEFPVAKATSLRSTLFSPSDIQSIVKKAVVESMKQKYKRPWYAEDGAHYGIHVFIHRDVVNLYVDASGFALHKRGYRNDKNIAPIKETLAYALTALTPWQPGRELIDPMCGSGTILIEAALAGANIAPGLDRRFVSESWELIPAELWRSVREEARSLIRHEPFRLQGFDIDGRVLAAARENAQAAGVGEYIHFQRRDVRDLRSPEKYGFIVTNPPYGTRLEDRDTVGLLYQEMGQAFARLDTWSYSIITAHEQFEECFGRQADKKRKLYNGMLKTYLYQYFGPRPPKRPQAGCKG